MSARSKKQQFAAWAALVLCAALTACDAERDQPVTPKDLEILTSACQHNGALVSAQRAWPVTTGVEWRVTCSDGIAYIVKASWAKRQ